MTDAIVPGVNDGHRWINATYEVLAAADEVESVARALATEQSVEMPLDAITDARVVALMRRASAVPST